MNNSNDDPNLEDMATTTFPETGDYTLYTIDKFMTQREADSACHVLQKVGFPAERLSIKTETIDPARGIAQSQVNEGAKGGAIAGAIVGGLVGCSLILLANNLPGSALNPTFSPWLGLIAGSLVGALGVGLMGAISGKDVPKMKPGTEEGALTQEYRVMLTGTRKDLQRATETLRQQNI